MIGGTASRALAVSTPAGTGSCQIDAGPPKRSALDGLTDRRFDDFVPTLRNDDRLVPTFTRKGDGVPACEVVEYLLNANLIAGPKSR